MHISKEEAEDSSPQLSRSISPALLTLYGLGTVLGAGIYVVVGEIIGRAGVLAPLSFVFAAAAAGLTAFSYAELSARVPKSGGSAAYAAEAFQSRWLTIAVGWGVVATGLVSAATIMTGFAGYLSVFVTLSNWVVIPAAVATLTLIAAVGIKQSTWFMGATTAAGVGGLFLVLFTAGSNLAEYPAALEAGLRMDGGIVPGVLLGGFLAFYAYIGFEDLVTLAEEARDVERALPAAIFIVLGVTLVLYVIVAATAVSTIDASRLADSDAPLVDVVREEGRSGDLLGALSLAIIINGALAQIVMAARVVHDLGERRDGAPDFLSRLNPRTNTPLAATLGAGMIVAALALFFPTERLASWTSYIILTVFAVVNGALINIKRQRIKPPEGARTYPASLPIAGLLVSLLLIVGETTLGGGHG